MNLVASKPLFKLLSIAWFFWLSLSIAESLVVGPFLRNFAFSAVENGICSLIEDLSDRFVCYEASISWVAFLSEAVAVSAPLFLLLLFLTHRVVEAGSTNHSLQTIVLAIPTCLPSAVYFMIYKSHTPTTFITYPLIVSGIYLSYKMNEHNKRFSGTRSAGPLP